METQTRKKKKVRFITSSNNYQGEDRISSLPDELIHQILKFVDAQLAVQTCVLSKRWKLIWATLPFLNFTNYMRRPDSVKFVDKFLSHHKDCHILKFNLAMKRCMPPKLVHRFISHAISHNVQDLSVDIMGLSIIKLSTFSSTCIKTLKLKTLHFRELLKTNCWCLPDLTTLHLIHYPPINNKLPESYLISLPCLRTLFLDGFNLPVSISLPHLTTLHLARCKSLPKVWDFPALLTLTLEDVQFPESTDEFFSALVNLRNLTLLFEDKLMTEFFINCPQLMNLEINACIGTIASQHSKIMVFAPKICNFSSIGFFPITFGVSQLENVNIKLPCSIRCSTTEPSEKLRAYYRQVIHMFRTLGSARILTLDLETIEALAAVSDFFVHFPSPFYNLKYVKVPEGYKESIISTCLKCYLLGGSPEATIVTTLPQNDVIPRMAPVSPIAPKVVLQEARESPFKELLAPKICIK